MVMDKIDFAKLLLVLVRLILYGRQFELLVGLASNNFDVAPRVNQNAVYFEIGDHGGYAYRRIPGVLEDSKIFLSKGDRPFLPLLQTFGGGSNPGAWTLRRCLFRFDFTLCTLAS